MSAGDQRKLPGGVIVVVGPTAVGKTELSCELARALDAEIVGADFVQEKGGSVERIPLAEGWSTSKIIDDIVYRYTHATDDEHTPPLGTPIPEPKE